LKNIRKNLLSAVAAIALGSAGGFLYPLYEQCTSNNTSVLDMFNKSALKCDKQDNSRARIERSCLSLKAFLDDPAAYQDEPGYESLMTISGSSSLSRQMLERVVKTAPEMRFCDMQLPPAVAAIYNNGRIGVDFTRDRTKADFITSIVHEMAHHYQKLNGSDIFDVKRSLADNQRVMLAMETAAPVVELLALHDAHQAGEIDWRTDIPPNSSDYKQMTEFSDRYDTLITEGHEPDEALNKAAQHSWQDVLQEQFRLDFYNKKLIHYTLSDRMFLKTRYADYKDPNIDQQISIAGQLTDKIDFTTPSEMPQNKDLFGDNDALRDLFSAVEWYRLSRMLEPEDPRLIKGKQQLIDSKNPYAKADFETATCKIFKGADVQDAFESSVKRIPPVRYTPLPHRPAAPGVPFKACEWKG